MTVSSQLMPEDDDGKVIPIGADKIRKMWKEQSDQRAGETSPIGARRLTNEQVQNIREAYDCTMQSLRAIGSQYGVNGAVIYYIGERMTYKDVPERPLKGTSNGHG